MKTLLGILFLVLGATTSPSLYAQEIVDIYSDSAYQNNGWGKRYRLSGSLSFNDNSNVVGKTDGLTSTFGGTSFTEGSYRQNEHLWKYQINLKEFFTKTPEIDKIIKTEDQFLISTEYLYFVFNQPAFGPFVSVQSDTPLFKSYDINSEDTDYVIEYSDGTTENQSTNQLLLTRSFRPFNLKETMGLFYFPYQERYFHLEFRTGAEAKQIFANNQLVISDDESTAGVVEVQELENIYALSWSLSGKTYGDLVKNNLSYEAFSNFSIPIALNESRRSNESKWDLYQLALGAKLISKFTNWFQLEYVFQANREPLILKDYQISHLIQFNVLIERLYGVYQTSEN